MNGLKIGSMVRVCIKLRGSLTERRYTINDTMLKMQGHEYEVHKIINPEKIKLYYPNASRGYVFHPDDLILHNYDYKSEQQIFKFNPHFLEI